MTFNVLSQCEADRMPACLLDDFFKKPCHGLQTRESAKRTLLQNFSKNPRDVTWRCLSVLCAPHLNLLVIFTEIRKNDTASFGGKS